MLSVKIKQSCPPPQTCYSAETLANRTIEEDLGTLKGSAFKRGLQPLVRQCECIELGSPMLNGLPKHSSLTSLGTVTLISGQLPCKITVTIQTAQD